MKKILQFSLLAVSAFLLSGCASIINGGGHQTVRVDSNPTGAKFTVFDAAGQVIETTNTPASLRLKRSAGYFHKGGYRLAFEADGYYPGELKIGSNLNDWYLGNIIFGGAIGLVIVDPLTGAMWTLDPDKINYTLVSSATPLSPEELKLAQAKANPPKSYSQTSTRSSVEKMMTPDTK